MAICPSQRMWESTMVGRRNGLTAAFVRAVRRPGRYYDGRGDGLILRVAAGGSKQWVWRGTVAGRRRDYGLGPVRYISLAEARRIAAEYRRVAWEGGDPRDIYPSSRESYRMDYRNRDHPSRGMHQDTYRRPEPRRPVPTFGEAAEIVIDLYAARWKPGSRSPDQWRQSLGDYAYPYIGLTAVDRITTADVMRVLTPIWVTKPTTAKRIRQRISAVMAWAIAEGHRGDDPAGPAITKALPKANGPKKHLASVPHHEAAEAVAEIRESGVYGPARLATEFAILTAARSSEVRGARWSEIDLDGAVWTIPGERMKAGLGHRVPLACEALRVLSEAGEFSDGSDPAAFVFPSVKGGGTRAVAVVETRERPQSRRHVARVS